MWCAWNSDEPHATWVSNPCNSTRQCVDTGHGAFCGLEPSSLCGNDEYVCDGTTLLECRPGWILGRAACESCVPGTSYVCAKGLGASCNADTDCLAGYRCFPATQLRQPGEPGECGLESGSSPSCPADASTALDATGLSVCFFFDFL